MTAPVSQVLSEAARDVACPACNGSGFGSSDYCGFCGGDGVVPDEAASRFAARRATQTRAAALAKEQGK